MPPLPPKEEAKLHVILSMPSEQTPGRGKKIRHSERSEESHRRTDGYIFLALVVGYFADAQYDVHSCFLLRGKWHEVPIGDISSYRA